MPDQRLRLLSRLKPTCGNEFTVALELTGKGSPLLFYAWRVLQQLNRLLQ